MGAGDHSPLLAGHASGRVKPQNWTPPHGEYAFVVGPEFASQEDDVAVGEYAGQKQDVDLTGVDLVTFAMKLRNTETEGIDFKASFLADGSELWSEQIDHGDTRDYVTRTINVCHLSGVTTLELRLEAVAP